MALMPLQRAYESEFTVVITEVCRDNYKLKHYEVAITLSTVKQRLRNTPLDQRS
jgi:hypothetical protein